MKNVKLFTWLFLVAFVVNCSNEKKINDFNLSFEQVENGKAVNWEDTSGTCDCKFAIDSTESRSGQNSMSIEAINDSQSEGLVGVAIPAHYSGERITVSAYIKTQSITNGYAGLFIMLGSDVDMNFNRLSGTNDWTKCEMSLDLQSHKTTHILIGAELRGSGKMWVDDFKITIDDKDIETIEPYKEKKTAPKEEYFSSGITDNDIEINPTTTKNLYDLGLIWGFLKYYHPIVASGKYDFDSELFRILPKVAYQEDMAIRDSILCDWIDDLGEFEINESVDTPSLDEVKAKLEPDLEWITSSKFSRELETMLSNVMIAVRDGYNHYVKISPFGTLIFPNNREYSGNDSVDLGLRILALYRYWNSIQYYFPYRYLIGEDWKGVLKEFIPIFTEATTMEMYKYAVHKIGCRINDTHSTSGYMPHYRRLGRSAAAFLRFVEGKAVVMGFLDVERGEQSGLQLGDIITHIDGKRVEDIVSDRLDESSASNYPQKLNQITPLLLWTDYSSLEIDFVRCGVKKSTAIDTYELDSFKRLDTRFSTQTDIITKEGFSILEDDIAYLYPELLKSGITDSIWNVIRDAKGLIIDMRCYPADNYFIDQISDKLLPEPTPHAIFTQGSTVTPGRFIEQRVSMAGSKNSDYYRGMVVVIVNETTISNAEFTAMALRQAPKAVVIGSTTAAADGNITTTYLPGGIKTVFTGLGVYTPEGEETQRIGIIPDIEIKPTIKGISQGRDELLEKAIEVIKSA